MSQQTATIVQDSHPDDAAEDLPPNNLVAIDKETSPAGLPNELNQKINRIDADLDDLKTALGEINGSVNHSLAALGDNDRDLTSQVSATYQQLGELDIAYQSLASQSAQISQAITSVSRDIVNISNQSETEIGKLSDGYAELIGRTDELWKKSRQATEHIKRSIQQNGQALGDLEQQLLKAIDSLDQTTRARDDSLDDKNQQLSDGLHKTNEAVRANQARILKLQSVDQALEKRAKALEASSRTLSNKGRELARRTTILSQHSSALSAALEELRLKTVEQGQKITDLESTTHDTDVRLTQQIRREARHVKTQGALLAMLIMAMLIIGAYEYHKWRQADAGHALQQASLQQLDRRSGNADARINGLSDRLDAGEISLQQQLDVIDNRLAGMDDQVESISGRLGNLRPNHSFGRDNQIHGPRWLAKQPANRHVILLTLVTDKPALFKLAERYGHYLPDDLAFLPLRKGEHQGYALLLGTYARRADAEARLSRLPPRIGQHRPGILTMAEVQQHLPTRGK